MHLGEWGHTDLRLMWFFDPIIVTRILKQRTCVSITVYIVTALKFPIIQRVYTINRKADNNGDQTLFTAKKCKFTHSRLLMCNSTE